jgi:hypothetical protein
MNAAAPDTVHIDAADRAALLAEADRAVGDGRHADAVELLTAANRLARDAATEAHILRQRHLAYDDVSDLPGLDTWPRQLPDPFPGTDGPPEIGLADLDAATLGGAILHHGCLIVRGFQPEAQALELREHVVAALDARDRIVEGRASADDHEWYLPFEPAHGDPEMERIWVQKVGGMLMADAPRIMVELLALFEDSGVTEAIAEYLGEPPALSFNKCVLRKLKESAPTWHQDGAFMGADLRTVDVWLSLSECGGGTDTPGLDILPMRIDDILEVETHGSIFPNSIGDGLVEIVAGGQPILSPRFAPGDAIIFDDRFVHRSGVGDFSRERYAIESWFFGSSRFPGSYIPILA